MAEPTYDVLCVGILVADVFASPMPRLPAAGELLAVDELLLQTGGCAANTAVDLAKLGRKVVVVGRVGNDVFAEFIRADLAGKGVDVSPLRVSRTAPTSRTVILPVIGEDRRYIHSVGANAELSPEDVDPAQVANARVLYVGGYPLFPGFGQDALAELFRHAREHSVKTVLDVAGVRADRGMGDFAQVLPHTDVFLPNDDEGYLITGEQDPLRQARAFVEQGVGVAVVTLGERGAVARTSRECLRAPAYRVEVVEPSGAGDAFDAGIIHGLLEGWDLRRMLAFASAMGASACTKLGCTAGVFTREEALRFVEQHPLEVSSPDGV
ncbi:MAG: carbohydrate kinase family protein [Chloroflexi bacterium]|nr:carbohydrate kinase family protein [Chloroflexota bacterium]